MLNVICTTSLSRTPRSCYTFAEHRSAGLVAPNRNNPSKPSDFRWSNRILLAAIAGVLFLTLYPFRVDLDRPAAQIAHPFLLGQGHKSVGAMDVFLNVLLFVPFGFGLAENLREKGKSRVETLFWAAAAGAVFSYAIEFSQLYIPPRDSGWTDVLTNGSGSVVGALLSELAGCFTLRLLSWCESTLARFVTLRRAAFGLSIYFAAFFSVSAMLQKQSRLSDWDPRASLWIASGTIKGISTGNMVLVQLWNRAVPNRLARELTSGQTAKNSSDGLLASYDLSGRPPFADRKDFLPALLPAVLGKTGPIFRLGSPWFASERPIDQFVRAVQRSNQFTIRAVYRPSSTTTMNWAVLAGSRVPSSGDVILRQRGADLIFWFRTPISMKGSSLAWETSVDLEAGTSEDILYSYDGSNLTLTINGKQFPEKFELTPGTVLAKRFRQIKVQELEGYALIYDLLVFLPAGFLLGMASRTSHTGAWWLPPVLLAPPIFFEFALSRTSGRPISSGNILLGVALTVCGFLWMNADCYRALLPARSRLA